MNNKQNTPYEIIEHNWEDYSIVDANSNTVATASVYDDPTEGEAEELEQRMADKLNFIIKACNNYDGLVHALSEARSALSQIRRSMMAHPDHQDGSEFDDMTTGAQIVENRIEKLLTELRK